MTRGPAKPSLLRNLGAFFGHIAHGVKSNPHAEPPAPPPPAPAAPAGVPPMPPPQVVRHEVAERTVQTPQGEFVLRRTVIDEVHPVAPPAAPRDPASGPP